MTEQETFGECTTPDGVTHQIINVVSTQKVANTETLVFLLDDKSIVMQVTDVTDPEKPLPQYIHLQIPQFALLFMGMHQCVERFGIDMDLVINTLAEEAKKEAVK